MKKIITFLLSLIIAYSPIYAFAGAAEQWNASPRQMTIADMGMRTRNGIGVENVRASNGMINADITQRVTVDGSNATINTKVSIPANDDTFARKTASHAKNLLRGGAWAAGAAVAMDVVLDGVGWVIDEGGKIKRPIEYSPNDEEYNKYTSQYKYRPINSQYNGGYFYSLENACKSYLTFLNGPSGKDTYVSSSGISCTYKNAASGNWSTNVGKYTNGDYNPSSLPTHTTPSDPEINDAFFNWFKNNPQSITDPVTTYIYSPKDSQGKALPKSPEGTDPSFGPNEITDEMMNNYMEHRNANLQNPYTTTIGDSTQIDTTQNPDGSKTSTKTNPDGSKTTTRTDTKTDPDTGEITTTVTETTTNPDGSTSTKTETSTQTKPKPETTDLPAFCDYAATLCTWMNRDTEHKAEEKSLWEKITDWFDWTKEEPDSDNKDNEVDTKEPEKFDTAVFKKDRFNVSKTCPVAETHTISLSGISVDFSFDLTPICTVLEFARPALVACSYLYAAYIVIGAARIG
ncbi:virulence factor TspB C-terminal domain-related protein [Acinetobacter sp. LA-1]|uniref:virulence factor TspB C-terminal domain-related protein n=1 Tax=Acinetobacter sp. LA-1 TaxID=3438431 RepID=UPI003F3611F2